MLLELAADRAAAANRLVELQDRMAELAATPLPSSGEVRLV